MRAIGRMWEKRQPPRGGLCEHRISGDVADRRRRARRRGSVHAGGRPRARVAGERHRCVRMHARHRPAHGGGDHGARGAPAHQRACLPDPEISGRGVPALHGLEHASRARRAERGSKGKRPALGDPGDRRRDPDQHPQSEALDFLSRVPAAVRDRRRAASARAHARAERGLHVPYIHRLRRLRDVRRRGPQPRDLAPAGADVDASYLCRRVCRARRKLALAER